MNGVQHHHLTPDEWRSIEQDPQFRALLRARRRFVVPASILFIAYYLALPIAAGFVRPLMTRTVFGPLTLGYAFAISQFFLAWIVLAIYLRRARAFDAAAERIGAAYQRKPA